MKKIFLAITVIIFLTACEKNSTAILTTTPTNNDAKIKFVNAYTALTPSLAATANGPTVDFFVNNVRATGALASVTLGSGLGYGVVYPSASGGYASCASGEVNIKAVLSRPVGTVGLASDTLVNGTYRIAPNGTYTVVMVDATPNPTPQSPNLMVIGESVSPPTTGKFKVRFLNLNATTETLELFNVTTSSVVTSGIVYKNLSEWIELPITNISNNYNIRIVGSTTNLVANVALNPTNQRSYTFWARGNPAISARARTLSFFTTQ